MKIIFFTFGSNTMIEIEQRKMIESFAADIACEKGCNESQTLRFQHYIMSERMQALLEASRQQEADPCSVCYVSDKTAFYMECGHWLCKKCAKKVARPFDGEWPCPLCRTPCQTPCVGREASRQSAYHRLHHLVTESLRNWLRFQ